jgi:glycosyltransferase involved in cell wall biosynthesis
VPARAEPRILHAPADVGGHAYGLSRGERELGLQSDVVVFAPGPFGYGYDVDIEAGIDGPVWRRLARRASFLRKAAREYDIFHFNFGLTFLTVRQFGVVLDELSLLKRLGKTVLVTYQGCDVRPKEACPCRKPPCYANTRYRAPAARRALANADRVFHLNPDLRRWLPGAQFMPYASVDARVIKARPEPEPDGEVVIAHAPTDVDIKGTRLLVAAVEQLRAEGVPVRLDLVQGVDQAEVLARCAAAHVVVDQLLLGWYGGLAVEAMALGRPVLAYIRELDPADNPFGDELPIVRTGQDTLADDIRALVFDAARRQELARAGRRFVETAHDPRRIAREALAGIIEPPPAPDASAEPAGEATARR